MAKGTAKTCSAFGMAIGIVCCILSLFIIGFFGYVAGDYIIIETSNGGEFVVNISGKTPWYVTVAIVMGCLDFLLTLTTSILGCVSLGGQATSRGVQISKLALDSLAWILMLVAAASCTGAAPYSLSDYTGSCSSFGWSISCSFGVGIALAWSVFCLLFINSVLHGVALKHAVSDQGPGPLAPAAPPGDIETA